MSDINTTQKFLALYAFLFNIEPKNVHEALVDSDWVTAMLEEVYQFERNKVWHLVPQPKDRLIIGTKWMFKNKLDEFGTVTRNKARLVVQVTTKKRELSMTKPSYLLQGLKLSAFW